MKIKRPAQLPEERLRTALRPYYAPQTTAALVDLYTPFLKLLATEGLSVRSVGAPTHREVLMHVGALMLDVLDPNPLDYAQSGARYGAYAKACGLFMQEFANHPRTTGQRVGVIVRPIEED